MIHVTLRAQLEPVARRLRARRRLLRLATCWSAASVLALVALLAHGRAGVPPLVLPTLAAVAAVAGVLFARRLQRQPTDWREAAQRVETLHPDLQGLLLTAAQQEPGPDGRWSFLQERLLDQALDHGRRHRWSDAVPTPALLRSHALHLASLAVLLALLALAPRATVTPETRPAAARGVEITPGDVELERGTPLVVSARFPQPAPSAVTLVVQPVGAPPVRLDLTRSLADPVFGGTLAEVGTNLTYRLEYGGRVSRDFQVRVFEFPRLERADATLTYPDYTGLPARRFEDTRRLTAVEGTRLDLALQFNQALASARLQPAGTSAPPITLTLATNRIAASLDGWILTNSQRWTLHLVDPAGRTNKVIPQFVVEVVTNRLPELKLTRPRGDPRPSPLEEVAFEGTVWDDFGLVAHGLGLTPPGGETRFLELGRNVPGREKKPFQHLLALEDLGVQPDDLVAWFVWADDIGPDGQVRRTVGDLFFGEIRPFEEIFRQADGGEGESEGEGGQPPGSPASRLAELQKQILTATWKLREASGRRRPPGYDADAAVLRDSQARALEQAGEEADGGNPQRQALWQAVIREMTRALDRLDLATNSPPALAEAIPAEQAAYQALLKLQPRETQVSRSRSRSRGQGESASQRQLDQLDLAEEEDRYETEKQAAATPPPERQEQLQALSRLQELARRQQDVNERLKELQTALQEARTEQEREQARRELKRLREEERQMLADLDELRQRMDRSENPSALGDQRQRLDETRQNVQQAADAAAQDSPGQALAAGTRAQEQLQEMRDQLRQQTASQFSDELRQMREQARNLARQQNDLSRQLDALNNQRGKSLSDSDERRQLLDRLAGQKQGLTNLLGQATRLSEQTETAEPLVSRELYDTLRQVSQDEARTVKEFRQALEERGMLGSSLAQKLEQTAEKETAKSMELTAEMIRRGLLPPASEANQRARAGVENLRDGVERAAARLIGDDTAALQEAQQQLARLTGELEQEMQADAASRTNRLAGGPGRPAADRPPDGERSEAGPGPGEPRPGDRPELADAGTSPGTSPGTPPGTSPAASPGEEGRSAAQPPGPRPSSSQGGNPPDALAGQSPASSPGQDPGQQPGPGQGQAQSQGEGQGQGQGQAQAQTPGDRPGQGQGQGQAQAQAQTPGRGQGQGQGQGQGPGQPQNGGETPAGGGREMAGNETDPAGRRPRSRSGSGGVARGGALSGPITGENFTPWADRLRDVEDLVDMPEVRQQIATARERARQARVQYKADQQKPDWAKFELEVVRPLVEVRDRLREELARRDSREALVPIDRDPVPTRYSELVRRYYENLGKER